MVSNGGLIKRYVCLYMFMISILRRCHPIWKILFVGQAILQGLMGPLLNTALVSGIVSAIVLLGSPNRAIRNGFVLAVVFVGVVILLSWVGGGADGLRDGVGDAVRLFSFMSIALLFACVVVPIDFGIMCSTLRLPHLGVIARALSSLIPVAVRTMNEVLFAQKARGLQFNLKLLLSVSTYSALVIPYVISMLGTTHALWITHSLRRELPSNLYSDRTYKIIAFEVVSFVVLCVLWWDFLEVLD